MKKILITGCLGFIGYNLSKLLLDKGFIIIGIDNLSGKYSKKIYNNKLNNLNYFKKFVFYQEDIQSSKRIHNIIKKLLPHLFIHCAAKVGVRESVTNPLDYTKVNVLGTQILLEGIRLYSPKTKLILFSSSSVYGQQKHLPFSENMKPNPISPYGLSKHLMEIIAKQYNKMFKIPIIVIRAFSVYGPGGRTDMLPFLLFKSYLKNKPIYLYGTNKNNRRDWTYIDDLVEAIYKIVIKKNIFQKFEIINIGRGESVGICDFVQYFISILKNYVNNKIKIVEKQRQIIETPITLADINKAKKLLNYYPKTTYKEGIYKTINFFMKNKSLYLND